MTTVNVHEAKTNLSRQLVRVEAGEEVVIARNGKPVARLVSCKPRVKPKPDVLKGLIDIDDSFFDPLPGGGTEVVGGVGEHFMNRTRALLDSILS